MGRLTATASAIVGCCRFLAARSQRFEDLVAEVSARLMLSRQTELPPGDNVFDPAELPARTEEFNRASERYFAQRREDEHLLRKPYGDPLAFPRALFDLGVLTRWLRLSPGETVLELGAGTCWLSHLLNRFGCKTIAVDVSETALELGRELFERESSTDWDLGPEFVVYDGHRIPLADGSVDKIVVYHAFHHVPNQEEILVELCRVLGDGGVVAMCEPGRRHSRQPHSRLEMDRHGVLENEILVEELEVLALRCGFSRLCVVPVTVSSPLEVPPRELAAFLRGEGLGNFWRSLCNDIRDSPYIVIYKGDFVPTSRLPQRLAARVEKVGGGGTVAAAAGTPARLRFRLTNTGDTRWLAAIDGQPGWTRLGAHLYRAGDGSAELEFDWCRWRLPRDVDPGERVELDVELPGLAEPGEYRVVLDLVAEEILWFARHDSPTLELRLVVSG